MSVTQTYLSRNSQALNIAERCGKTEVHVYSRFIYFFYLSLFFQFFFFCTGLFFPLCHRCYNIRLSVCRFYNPLVFYYENLQIVCLAQPAFFFAHTPLLTKNCSWDSASLNWPISIMDLRSSLNWVSMRSLTDSIRSIKWL